MERILGVMQSPQMFIITILGLLLISYYAYNLYKQKKLLPTLVAVATISLLLYFGHRTFWPRIYDFLTQRGGRQIAQQYVYDTDPKNDLFIKGNLPIFKLVRLDRILEAEKQNGGMRLNHQELNAISRYDNDLTEAYSRWWACKDQLRSFHHVVYPSERPKGRGK